MKILFLSLVFAGIIWARPTPPADGSVIDASSTNVPTAYDTSAGSQIVLSRGAISHFSIRNDGTGVALAVHVGGVLCESADADQFYVLNGEGFVSDEVAINKVICIRSLGAAAVAGSVYVSAW